MAYIQHGDASKSNILVDGEKYCFIDFDTINIYPALVDFFRLLIDIEYGIKSFVNGYFDNELEEFFKKENIVFSELEKDKYLACFILTNRVWAKRIRIDDLPHTYELSLKALGE